MDISIHVPREGDDVRGGRADGPAEISIHVPREGDDFKTEIARRRHYRFQSTSPVRGTTQ